MKVNWRKICGVITFGHWWKHYPGEKRYVRCRLCGQMSKSMWNMLQESKGKKKLKSWGLAWIQEICIAVPFERTKK